MPCRRGARGWSTTAAIRSTECNAPGMPLMMELCCRQAAFSVEPNGGTSKYVSSLNQDIAPDGSRFVATFPGAWTTWLAPLQINMVQNWRGTAAAGADELIGSRHRRSVHKSLGIELGPAAMARQQARGTSTLEDLEPASRAAQALASPVIPDIARSSRRSLLVARAQRVQPSSLVPADLQAGSSLRGLLQFPTAPTLNERDGRLVRKIGHRPPA